MTYYDGAGSRDWSAIVEADPVHVVQYRQSLYGFATVRDLDTHVWLTARGVIYPSHCLDLDFFCFDGGLT